MPTRYILDTRENHLQALFASNSVPFETRQLDLGDILILYSKGEIRDKKDEPSSAAQRLLREKSDPKTETEEKIQSEVHTIIIERKSFTDLKSSMADGRYHEQKARYAKLPRGTCYYLLENNDPNFSQLGRKQFLGTYIHTMMRDEIPVFLTSSLENTFEFLVKMGQSLEQFGVDGRDACPAEATQIKKKKAAGKDVYKQQLCCFPGISAGKAEVIAAVYSNMTSLIAAVRQNSFKVKGIGKVLLQNIKESLLLEDESFKPLIVFG